MSKYALRRICLKNFKLFGGEPYTITFPSGPLVVFDGPNGYGKTSVFDAIELAITGNIKRLYPVENKQVPSDLVVAHKDCPDVEILIEFSGNPSFTVIRRLKKPLPARGTRIDRFSDSWDLYALVDNNEVPITELEFHSTLNNSNIVRDYHLLHYVQQEETAHFLKSNKEHQRADELTELFGDTKEAEITRDKLEVLSKKISTIKARLNGEIKLIETRYDMSPTKGQGANGEIDHKFLLPWLKDKTSPAWDAQEIIDLSLDKKNKFIEELSQVKKLIINRETFVAERVFRKVAKAKALLKSFIQFHNYIDRIEELRNKARIVQIINTVIDKFKIDRIGLIEDTFELGQLFDAIEFSGKSDFFNGIQEIVKAQNISRGNNQLYTEIIRYRDEIAKRLPKLDMTDKCPLCGTPYESSDTLFSAIEECGEDYKGLIGEGGKRLLVLQSSFESEVLNPLVDKILIYRDGLNAPTPELIAAMDESIKSKEQLSKLGNWLLEQQISFNDLCADYSPTASTESDCEQRVNQLLERIRAKSPTLQFEYSESNLIEVLDRIFIDYFEGNTELLNSMAIESVDNKIAYIQYCYFGSLSNVIERHRSLKAIIGQLEAKDDALRKIRGIIQKEIRTYQKKLITDIEIPFFIYSGKILQTHQAGLGNGIFVKDPTGGDELKNVRFVSDWNSDHDILNTMSSGQIAAVVISLTLTLNRVYANQFNSIFIDDPVQTMDDINMISLVELLRNEFADRQVMISTHEDEVSRYFLYKYLKHGHSVMKINLMERKEYRLSHNT